MMSDGRLRLGLQVHNREQQKRCPACLSEIRPSDEVISCQRKHAAIHRACGVLLTSCPCVGCQLELQVSDPPQTRFLPGMKRLGQGPEWNSRHFAAMRIEAADNEIDRLRRYSKKLGCFLGFFCLIFPPFFLLLAPALFGLRKQLDKEEKRLRESLLSFGGRSAFESYRRLRESGADNPVH